MTKIPFYTVDSSVDGESYILVKHHEKVERLSIKELYKRNLEEEFRTTSFETRVPLDEYEVLTTDENNKVVWGKLNGVIKHLVKKPTVRINIESGKEIICTTDHSIITMDKDGNLIETSANELKEGDYILSPKSFSNNFDDVGFVKLLIQKPNFSKENLEVQMVEVTDEFLQFLGLWIGDGCYFSHDKTIGLSCYQDAECREVIDAICRMYSAKPYVCPNGIDVRISNVRLQRIMEKLGVLGTSSTKRIPKFIYSLSKYQIAQFLKGYYSADGSGISCDCFTVSEELKKDLVVLLNMFEIYPSVSYSPSGRYLIMGKEGEKKESWHITIRDTNSRINFQKSIGFLQEYKTSSLEKAIKAQEGKLGIRSKKLGIPVNLAKSPMVCYPSGSTSSVSKVNGRVSRGANIGRFDDRVINSELLFLQIKSIEEVSSGVEEVEVYDLSVDKYERFFANGVLVHNTTWLVGTQFGELNFFDGRKMKRLKKAVWKTQYRNKLIELGANWNLAEREEPYELIRINVLTFLQVEKYVRSLMKNKMYWLKDGFKKMDRIEMPKRTEQDICPDVPTFDWYDGDMEDWMDICFELGVDVNLGKDEACNILRHYSNFIIFDTEAIEKYSDDDIFYFVDLFGLKESCNTRKKAMGVLQDMFKDNARGARHDFEHISENAGDVRVKPKEREEYIEEESTITMELDKKTVESVLAQFIPESTEMPEVEEYDRILATQGIVAVRDEKGRLLKGQQQVRKKKHIYPESMYKLSCDTCIKSATCPDYSEGYVCAYNKMFKRFNTRDMRDIQDAMHSIVETNLERLQRAMMFEMMDGGVIDPTVTQLMDTNLKYMQMLQQMDNLGRQLVAQQRVVVDAQGNSETTMTVSANPQQGGILAKLFGGMGDRGRGEEKEVIDITPKDGD